MWETMAIFPYLSFGRNMGDVVRTEYSQLGRRLRARVFETSSRTDSFNVLNMDRSYVISLNVSHGI